MNIYKNRRHLSITMKTTAAANANIAIIKYWGMRDQKLVVPMNDSISFTMDGQLQTITTVEFRDGLKKDVLFLDGKRATEKERSRVHGFLDIVRRMGRTKRFAHVVSMNSFPKSAGLASSASGFAALAAAASSAAGLELDGRELSALARMGSGSAARSVYGGAVEWHAGKNKDGSDCYAVQLSPPERWRTLRNVIAITNSGQKKTGSMEGMHRTTGTSELYSCRLKTLPKRLALVRKAVMNGKFSGMAQAIMQESDSMHAAMLDSWPPLLYLNGASLRIMDAVLELNGSYGEPVAAYTFDAGPNAHVYTTARHENEVRKALATVEGIEKIITCRVGEGVRYPKRHLF
jgi:diphosphomevalonate decarboxylase